MNKKEKIAGVGKWRERGKEGGREKTKRDFNGKYRSECKACIMCTLFEMELYDKTELEKLE